MSICHQGMDERLYQSSSVVIQVSLDHPLIKLMNALDWQSLYLLVLPDLKKTASSQRWWLGRKLSCRMHLGVYLVQQLYNLTDRGVEQQLKDNAVYAVFCGCLFIKNWRVPDHSNIERFRSRLSPETQCQLANIIAKQALKKGFCKSL